MPISFDDVMNNVQMCHPAFLKQKIKNTRTCDTLAQPCTSTLCQMCTSSDTLLSAAGPRPCSTSVHST